MFALIAAFIAGIAFTLACLRIFRWGRAWRDRPRESRRQRRLRLFHSYVGHGLDAAERGRPLDARYWARRAARIDANHAEALHARGQAELAAQRQALALAYFERAYDRGSATLFAGLPRGFVAQVAISAAQATALMRNQCSDAVERESLSEQVLWWARIAADDDPTSVMELENTPHLYDLRHSIHFAANCVVEP